MISDTSEFALHLRMMISAFMSQQRDVMCKEHMHGMTAWQTFDVAPFDKVSLSRGLARLCKHMDWLGSIGRDCGKRQHFASSYYLTEP